MLRSLAIQNYNFKLTPEINNPTYSGKSPTFVHINMAGHTENLLISNCVSGQLSYLSPVIGGYFLQYTGKNVV